MILHSKLFLLTPQYFVLFRLVKVPKVCHPRISLLLNGYPLAEHTLNFASLLGGFDDIIFTTDCSFLLSRSHLYPQITYHSRDSILSSDDATLVDVITFLYKNLLAPIAGSNPAFVLLQPTSPFRSLPEVRKAINLASASGLDSLVSVSSLPFHPSEFVEFNSNSWTFLVPPPNSNSRRQDYSQSPYFISGSLYITSLEHLSTHGSFISPDSSFFHAQEPYVLDIDSSADFSAAQALYSLFQSAGYAAPYVEC